MIAKEYYKTRADGVRLFITIDAQVDNEGNFLRDEKNELVPTGFYIMQNETGAMYDKATDVENSPYTYSETTEKIEKPEKIEESEII